MPHSSAQPNDDPDSYVGQPVQAAKEAAEGRGWTTVRTLAPDAVITMEYREGRLNLVEDGGTVTRCWAG